VLVGQRAAVEEQGMTGAGEQADHLVHDPAVDADPAVLGLVPEQRRADGVRLPVRGRRESQDGRHRHRGRGGQSRAERNVAGHHAVPAGEGPAGLLHRPGRAFDVFRPAFVFLQVIQRELGGLVVFQRVDDGAPVGARAKGDAHGAVNRHRQDVALVVVGVLADQVHPSRRADEEGWLCTKMSLECLNDGALLWFHAFDYNCMAWMSSKSA
jgi:hypothetical protein